MTRSFHRLLFSSMVLLALVFPVTSSVAAGSARSASSDANNQTPTTPSQADVPIKGWPARGPMLAMICPGVLVCYAVGSLPQPDPLPTKPPSSPPGAIIARTEDGGQTWAYHVDPHSVFGGMACPGPTQCYVTAEHPHVRTIDQHHQIVTWTVGISVTRDGGETWREHTLPNAGDTNADLACPTITTCVVWGGSTSLNSPRATVFITTDGGNSWKASQVITHQQTSIARLVCPGVQRCYLYGGIQGTAVSESQDTGRTWRVLPRSDMFTLSGVPPRSLAHLGGISCPSARVCYTAQGEPRCKCDAWGPYGTIFGTQDAGKHWAQLYRAHGGNYPEGVIDCPTITVCYAVGSKQRDVLADQIILSTKDAGRSWAIHRLPVAGLSCPSADVCYAFAYSGTVYKTTDGGTAWQPLP